MLIRPGEHPLDSQTTWIVNRKAIHRGALEAIYSSCGEISKHLLAIIHALKADSLALEVATKYRTVRVIAE